MDGTETVTWLLQGGDDLAKVELSALTLWWAKNGTKNDEVRQMTPYCEIMPTS